MSDTEAGGIVAKLKLDSADFVAKVDEANAKAKELGQNPPNVNVKADTADAQAKLDEVRLTADKVGAKSPTVTVKANTAEADAWLAVTKKLEDSLNSSVAAANARIDQMGRSYGDAAPEVEKYVSSATRARQAEEAAVQDAINNFKARTQAAAAEHQQAVEVERSTQAFKDWSTAVKSSATSSDVLSTSGAKQLAGLLKLSDANNKVASARSALTRVQKDAAATDEVLAAASRALTDAQLEQAAAADAVRAATAATAESSADGGFMNPATLAAGVAAAISLIGPLTAEVAGLAGGLVGMGAAGIAAFAGISEQIHNNTQLGQAYKSGLDEMKSDLEGLEQVAAQGVLNGFQLSVADVQKEMPALNSEVKDLSGYLGQSGSNLIDGVVHGLGLAKPLLEEGARILDQWTSEFDAWTHNGGLQTFLDYAQKELPIVTQDLGTLANTGMDFIEMLSGGGNELLSYATGIVEILDLLPKFVDWENKAIASMQATPGAASAVGAALGVMKSPATTVLGLITNLTNKTVDLKGAQQALADGNYAAYVNAVAGAHVKAVKPINDVAHQLSTEGQNAQDAANKVNALSAALTGLDNGQLSAASAELQFNQAVTAATASVKQNGRGLNENTAAGQANMGALLQVAQSALQVEGAQATAHASTETLTASMATARGKFIAVAESMGQTAGQANALANQYGLIPANVTTTVKAAGIDQAVADAHAVQNAFASIQRTVGVNVITTHTDINGNTASATVSGAGSAGTRLIAKAHGGPVLAASGLMNVSGPGSAWDDIIPARLSNGESVVQARSAQAYPGFLAAYNQDPTKALKQVMAAGVGMGQTPPVYVQNPFTGEYLLAQVANQTKGQVRSALDQEAQIGSVGVTTSVGVVI